MMMMKTFTTTAAASVLTLALSAMPGNAQEATTFDIDRDQTTGHAAFEDFNKGFDEWGTYEAWDQDRDDLLTIDEFGAGMFGLFDVDRDEALTRDEYIAMQRAGLGRGGIFDREEQLTRGQFTRRTFERFDVNENEVLEEHEIEAMQLDPLFAEPTVKAGGAPTATQD